MLTWVGIAAFVGTGYVALRWAFARTDLLGRERSFPWISAVFLVAVGCAALAPGILRARLESRLREAAATIAGRQVEVRCQALGEAFVDGGSEIGYVPTGPDGRPQPSTLIKRAQCEDLSEYLGSDKVAPTRDQIVAVHVLTHEAIHMSGVSDEATTECLAMQRDAETAQLLGASSQQAHALAVEYWDTVYPWMPDGYRSGDCGPGLALDAGLPNAPWQGIEASAAGQ